MRVRNFSVLRIELPLGSLPLLAVGTVMSSRVLIPATPAQQPVDQMTMTSILCYKALRIVF